MGEITSAWTFCLSFRGEPGIQWPARSLAIDTFSTNKLRARLQPAGLGRAWEDWARRPVGHGDEFRALGRQFLPIPTSSLRKNLEIEPMFSPVRVEFWRWIELWSLRSAVGYAATSLGMRIRL